jgi:proline dehydrogenase
MAMRMLGNQFVTGQTIDEALKNSRDNEAAATAIPTTCWAKPP